MTANQYRDPTPYTVSPQGLAWRTSPLLPIESMATRQYSLLTLLTVAQENGLDMPPLILAFASEHRRRFRYRLKRLATQLQETGCLATALEQTPEVLSDHAVTAIRLGVETDTLLSTLQFLCKTEEVKSDETKEKWISLVVFGLGSAPVGIIIISGFVFFIIPTFKKMFDEFELRLPLVTQQVISASDVFARYFALVWCLMLLFGIIYFATPTGFYLRRMIAQFVFGVHTSLSRGRLLQLLSLAASAKQPIEVTLEKLAIFHPVPGIRRRLRNSIASMDKGVGLWQSLRGQGLVSARQSQGLASMPDDASRAWTLLRFAKLKDQAWRRRAYTFISLFQPIVVIALAFIVCVICLACFSPLIGLIWSMANA